jgi:hypothetical protein
LVNFVEFEKNNLKVVIVASLYPNYLQIREIPTKIHENLEIRSIKKANVAPLRVEQNRIRA